MHSRESSDGSGHAAHGKLGGSDVMGEYLISYYRIICLILIQECLPCPIPCSLSRLNQIISALRFALFFMSFSGPQIAVGSQMTC